MSKFKLYIQSNLPGLFLVAVIAVMLLISAVQASSGTTFYVSNTGSDSASGKSSAPFATMQYAFLQAGPGDTILVENGTYAGIRDFSRSGIDGNPITFKANGDNVVINRGYNGAIDNVEVHGSHLVIDGFIIEDAGRSGVAVIGGRDVVVKNNIVRNNGRWGIFTAFAPEVRILDNVTFGSVDEHGIYVSNSDVANDNPVVVGNVSYGNNENGIQLNGDCYAGGDGILSGAMISDNIVYENGYKGLSIISVRDSQISNNLIVENRLRAGAAGIHLTDEPGCGKYSSNVSVFNNTIYEPRMTAVRITDGSLDNTVFNNILLGTKGGYVDEVGGNYFASNLVSGNLSSLFVNHSSRNYHLKSGSTAIDAGVASYNGVAAAIDALDGAARPAGSGYDLGAYEFEGVASDLEPDPDPTPDPEPTLDPEPTPAPDATLYETFSSYASGDDPTGWFDTDASNSMVGFDSFAVVNLDEQKVLSVSGNALSSKNNYHSHYTADGSDLWKDYEYSGRMMIDGHSAAGIGVTFYSDYPNSDSYYRIRRYIYSSEFKLTDHGVRAQWVGTTNSGVAPELGYWYNFKIEVLNVPEGTHVKAKIWKDDDLEPSNWQINAIDTGSRKISSGAPGVWANGVDNIKALKYWDNLIVKPIGSPDPVPEADPTPDQNPVPDPDSVPDPDPGVYFYENFSSYTDGEDPVNWFDTNYGNSMSYFDSFKVTALDDDNVLSLSDGAVYSNNNYHSHYMGSGSEDMSDYEYSGRMRFEGHDAAGIGVTFYSDYPNSDSYYRIRRYRYEPEFRLSNHGTSGTLSGDLVGPNPQINVWYKFKIHVESVDGGTHIKAKIWKDGFVEPLEWDINALHSHENRFTSGRVGVWANGVDRKTAKKYWDDLSLRPL